ncbi:MAG TPA: ATP-binding protein [Acetobacteraceae bacterium]|jgi:signal transduction histidine kinase|nr:ATP-binding protein [Acetobacteraceae bacterium]
MSGELATASDRPRLGAKVAAASFNPLRGRLFQKYILLFMGLVSAALLANAGVDLYFTYRTGELLLARLQMEKADAAAERISQFFTETEDQIGWTTHVQWAAGALDERRSDFFRLLRQVPAITELSELDGQGKEQLRVSRLAMDVVGSQADYSKDARFNEAVAHKLWFSPVYLRRGSEPYLTMAIARAGRGAGVTVAEVNLKLIWDVISSVRVGNTGYAFVVDRSGHLVAHPDISLVLRDTNFGGLPYVAAALQTVSDPNIPTADATVQTSFEGRRVLTAHAVLPDLGWVVFVELPMTEALAPLYASALRSGAVLLSGMAVATLVAMVLVRRMVGPIRLLQAGAARIGAGDLDSHIDVRTGDELEDLAGQFNTMAAQLREYNAGLERTVEERTRDLARSVTELQALSDVVRAVNSTLELRVVLTKIVAYAIELANADAGAIFRHNADDGTFELAGSSGMDTALLAKLRSTRVVSDETAMGEATETRQPVQIADMGLGPRYPLREAGFAAGFRAALIVPLIGPEQVLGDLVLVRRAIGAFEPSAIELMATFASQSALALQNAALFQELAEKGRQLELASEHKSQFLANMSHELRTPLNAILGYAELLADGIYGDLPEKPRGVLGRVQENGRNLLALINDVLDLAKIEAGQLTIHREDYDVASLVRNVVDAMEPLARAKRLSLTASVQPGLPAGFGDARRLQQVLVNLLGNAIKFTDAGEVAVSAGMTGARFNLAVRDTGPGIAPQDQAKIFEEFQQIDNSTTRRKGGTGLGLAISRKIVLMHGGHLSVVSAVGHGATFHVDIPVRVGSIAG